MGLLGLLIGTFKESVFGTEETVAFTAVLAATVTNYVFEFALLFFFFGKPVASVRILMITLILSCIMNSILAPFVYSTVKASSNFITAEQ